MIQHKESIYYNINSSFHDTLQDRYDELFWEIVTIVNYVWDEQRVLRLFRDRVEFPLDE